MGKKFTYIKGLDTIRFIAVLLVIVYHWGVFYPEGSTQYELLSVIIPWHKFGVPFFLVLSGFLISSILFEARISMTENDSRPAIIKNFLVRRALRLLPIYYIMLTFLYIIGHQTIREHPFFFYFHISNIMVYIEQVPNGLGHLWSLSLQEQFYLVLPWLVLYASDKSMKYIIYGGIIFGFVTKYYAIYALHKPFATLTFHEFDALGIGVLYAYNIYMGKKEDFERVVKFLFPILLYFAWQMYFFRGSKAGVMFTQFIYIYIGLNLIIYTMNNKIKFLEKYFFNNKVLNHLGKISYGIYLFHYPYGSYFDEFYNEFAAAHNIQHNATNFAIMYLFKVGGVILLALLSFRFIETPFMNLKKKFTYVKKKDTGILPVEKD